MWLQGIPCARMRTTWANATCVPWGRMCNVIPHVIMGTICKWVPWGRMCTMCGCMPYAQMPTIRTNVNHMCEYEPCVGIYTVMPCNGKSSIWVQCSTIITLHVTYHMISTNANPRTNRYLSGNPFQRIELISDLKIGKSVRSWSSSTNWIEVSNWSGIQKGWNWNELT